MQKVIKWMAFSAMFAGASAVLAQSLSDTVSPHNVVQLSAAGSVEVQQDLLVLTLSTTRDGTDAVSVGRARPDGHAHRQLQSEPALWKEQPD